jgi:hypothetical protein
MQDNDILNNAHYLRYDTSLDTGEGTYNSRQ